METLNPLAALVSSPPGVADVPRPTFVLTYEQKNITTDVAPYVTSVAYTDFLSGQSDEIEVVLEDTDGRWRGAWYPGKGDTLALQIGYLGAPLLPCGRFEIDELSFDDPPSTVTIRALATGVAAPLRTSRSKPYEQTTLAAIAARVAKRNRLTLTGKIREIRIDRITQYEEHDVAFLARLAREYGYAFKIVGPKLVFTELAALRDTGAALRFTRGDLKSIRLTDKIKDVYAQAKGGYHNPATKKLIVYGVKDGKVDVAGESSAPAAAGRDASGDTLRVTARAGSKATLETRTQAALDRSNLQRTTGTFELDGNTRLVAGNSIELVGYGRLSGKYLIESARHRIDRGSGYTTEIEVKRSSHETGGERGAQAGKRPARKPPAKPLIAYGAPDPSSNQTKDTKSK
ncbi:phage late control D family protein [Burkholderia thailandensis 34]|uniref:phage late control D family protein n=1 Tax=Burkholderia thailandensis TaxID=57975 RepID=UPI0005DA4498|nr:contractile injection system protein, VgrG/Pvc8 family [Burkholderia thailandensis]AJY32453.1 phage late control D family protein [Burkholderia thailandensis 34]AOJ59209.1 Cro/Cl family transcriptional regulator [Burkholderia thailandensis]KXF58328.1 Cro/Cl family transcriptional regulator [Burkholderia thailandensis]PNE76911.1 phage protein D [Burkholderia thailandensis]